MSSHAHEWITRFVFVDIEWSPGVALRITYKTCNCGKVLF